VERATGMKNVKKIYREIGGRKAWVFFCQIFIKIDLQENIPTFAFLADESVFICKGGGAQGLCKKQKLPQKVSDCKRSLLSIKY
jgi:hypothetical protein